MLEASLLWNDCLACTWSLLTAHFPSRRQLIWINIFIVYFVSVLRTNAHPHIYALLLFHCVKNICSNLLEVPVLINHSIKYFWYIPSVSKPWGGKEKKSFMHLGTICSCSSLSHFSWFQWETQQMRADLFSTLQMCWNEFSHSLYRMLFLFTAVQICSKKWGSWIKDQPAGSRYFISKSCLWKKTKNLSLSRLYMKYI